MIYLKIVFAIELNRHLSVAKNAISFLVRLFDQRDQSFIDLLVEMFAFI